jgi:hypothetical protein
MTSDFESIKVIPDSDIDELSLCDDEIRAVFEGSGNGSYFVGTPTIAQLTKEIRLLREEITRALSILGLSDGVRLNWPGQKEEGIE